jgi:hypothetical protein
MIRERRIFRPYILILTDSVLHPDGITAIEYQRLKHIPVPRSISDRLLADQLVTISQIVCEHYVTSCGVLAGYGAISGYDFRRSLEDTIRFDTEGRAVNYFARAQIEVQPRKSMLPRRADGRTYRSDSRAAPSPSSLPAVGDNLGAR